MGYNTSYYGSAIITPMPDAEFATKLDNWLNQRHVLFDANDIYNFDPDADYHTVDGNPVAPNGWNWIYGDRMNGIYTIQDLTSNLVPIDGNQPPEPFTELWTEWCIVNGNEIQWTQTEKSYGMRESLETIIEKILYPNGYEVNGAFDYQGEDDDDYGSFEINHDEVEGDYPRY